MGIRFTKDVEEERARNAKQEHDSKKNSYHLYHSTSLVQALHKARDLGWKDKKVQVREERVAEDEYEYYVEPFEKGCGCRGLLRYRDFFD